jgi:hypothetical protein
MADYIDEIKAIADGQRAYALDMLKFNAGQARESQYVDASIKQTNAWTGKPDKLQIPQ